MYFIVCPELQRNSYAPSLIITVIEFMHVDTIALGRRNGSGCVITNLRPVRYVLSQMETLDRDTVDLLSRRAFDVAASTRGVKVLLNGKRLPTQSFKDYVDMCLKVCATSLNKQGCRIKYRPSQLGWESN